MLFAAMARTLNTKIIISNGISHNRCRYAYPFQFPGLVRAIIRRKALHLIGNYIMELLNAFALPGRREAIFTTRPIALLLEKM